MAKIIFVQREIEDKLGPMLLTSFIKSKGLEAKIIIDPYKNINEFKKIKPDFIGISFCSPSVDWAIATSIFLKKNLPRSLIIVGGPHPTFFPQIIEQNSVDIVCIGEGEKPLYELLKKYNGNISSIENISNLWIKNSNSIIKNTVCPLLTEDELSLLPFSDRSHYDQYPILKNNPHKKIWTSRGCPFNCSYCFNATYKRIYKGQGKIVRQRSVDSVINELIELKNNYGWRCLEIIDDQFLYNKEWLFNFCERYAKEINLPFTCCSIAKQIKPELVYALKKAGCRTINFAIESGVERIRKEIYNKPVSDDDIYKAVDALHAHNMKFLTFNMIGYPDETLEDIYATIKINQKIKTTYPWCSILQPYPGTEISNRINKGNNSLKFTYSYFQSSIVQDPEKRKIFSNAQKLFTYCVKANIDYNKFTQLVKNPILMTDKLYPLIFYWYYGRDIMRRLDVDWRYLVYLGRYWLYSWK
jgi:radical SAM superfamily enzyme YgiQ (UPF0313 family)